eukprot:TRINITY_DN15053_c0_g1_i6.p1 TRINITY_DN15053_c0_g1~~TRINITY_DN15053_c0_g1_i6.p1  ORF type:complete len:146 (-),score=12.31 TRINITY_DN15053_c0_g1_i6:257-694(-)
MESKLKRAKCKFCSKIYGAGSKGGTGHLSRHRTKCLALHKLVNAGARTPGSQTQVSTTGGGSNSSSLGIFSFNAQSARQNLVKMIVYPNYHFLLLKMSFLKNEYRNTANHNFTVFQEILLEMMLLDSYRKIKQILKIILQKFLVE